MATVSRHVAAAPGQVWDVMADGWLYPLWVVGASRMREVEGPWPEPGSRLHHSVGVWPLLLDDTTQVLEQTVESHLRLEARGRPAGRAVVDIRLAPSGTGTDVSIAEDVVSGPARLVPPPARHPGVAWRNTETLQRLAFLAERRPVGGP